MVLVNRRLDEWVKLSQLDLDTVEIPGEEKTDDKVHFSISAFLLDFFLSNSDACAYVVCSQWE